MTQAQTHIDHSFQLHHRRLRERFAMATIERHEQRVMDAIAARIERGRAS